ncbi:hypothetical protein MNBD_NITROSPINAE01-1163 [hydrothermal vent metagenome]|uniref:Response regulatory domain-containing protein n=1 Tax=hydrothermal vent metagenome TaxID=652676 RepID=A0A3B1BPB0_9ZZZZ
MAHELADTKILIVDNQSEIRNMRETLRDIGFNSVKDLTSGLKVLTEIQKETPDVVLVNYYLPQYSGMQVFKSLSGTKAFASVKFIMIVPKTDSRKIKDGIIADGISTLLERPFSSDELRESIFSLFGMGMEHMKQVAELQMQEGHELFEAGDYENAVQKFREAGDVVSNPESIFWQGRCYLEMGMFDQANASFQNANKGKRYPGISKWLGFLHIAKKDYKEAITHLDRAIKEDKADPFLLVARGKCQLFIDTESMAEVSFNGATSLAPNDEKVKLEIGNAYLEKELYDKAEKMFGAAIKIASNDIQLYNRMAIALRKQGKFKRAIEIYVMALKIDPENEGLYYNLARALHESGDDEKAIKVLNKALDLDPEFTEARELKKEYTKG